MGRGSGSPGASGPGHGGDSPRTGLGRVPATDELIAAPGSRGRMSCLEELLAKTARSVEGELRPRLSGIFGSIVRAYLPQLWVFRTDEGTVSLAIDRQGRAQVVAGALPNPDVTVEIPHDRLRAALTQRSRAAIPPGALTVTPHTAKGRTAFDYLKGRLGF